MIKENRLILTDNCLSLSVAVSTSASMFIVYSYVTMNAQFDQSPKSKSNQKKTTQGVFGSSMPSTVLVNAKLEMTSPGDTEELEADAMADSIVSEGKIARAISPGHSGGGIVLPSPFSSQIATFQGQGSRIAGDLKTRMESGFGRDFSNIRIHTDNSAAEMSSSISAKAFTYGNDIFFNHGQYNPDTKDGQHLIAHELTHVVQGGVSVKREPEFLFQDSDEVDNLTSGQTTSFPDSSDINNESFNSMDNTGVEKAKERESHAKPVLDDASSHQGVASPLEESRYETLHSIVSSKKTEDEKVQELIDLLIETTALEADKGYREKVVEYKEDGKYKSLSNLCKIERKYKTDIDPYNKRMKALTEQKRGENNSEVKKSLDDEITSIKNDGVYLDLSSKLSKIKGIKDNLIISSGFAYPLTKKRFDELERNNNKELEKIKRPTTFRDFITKPSGEVYKSSDGIYVSYDGNGDFTQYHMDMGLTDTIGEAWCDWFVHWSFLNTFHPQGFQNPKNAENKKTTQKILSSTMFEIFDGKHGHGMRGSVRNSISFFRDKEAFDKNPRKGDAIFFQIPGEKYPHHIGLVANVIGDFVYTIEGNTKGDIISRQEVFGEQGESQNVSSTVEANGNGVYYRKYRKDDPQIVGYGHPDYKGLLSIYNDTI